MGFYLLVFLTLGGLLWHLFSSNAREPPSSCYPRKNAMQFHLPPLFIPPLFLSNLFYFLFYLLIWEQPLRDDLARQRRKREGLCRG